MKIKTVKTILFTALLALSLTACGSGGTNAGDQSASEDSAGTPSQADTDSKQSAKDDVLTYLPLNEGDSAPDFTISLADGSEFTLSDQQGKIVLLNFWATWCGPCVREMPAFERLEEDCGEDVVILAVNCMEYADTVTAFIEENGYTFPIAIDEEGIVSAKYPTQGIPYTLVIDGDGIVQNIYVGAADADTQYNEYKSAIDAIAGSVE